MQMHLQSNKQRWGQLERPSSQHPEDSKGHISKVKQRAVFVYEWYPMQSAGAGNARGIVD